MKKRGGRGEITRLLILKGKTRILGDRRKEKNNRGDMRIRTCIARVDKS